MNTTPKIPNPKLWTIEKCEELDRLEMLLRTIAGLNNGNNFIENLQGCIAEAEKLSSGDWKATDFKQPFLHFLSDCARCDRFYGGDPEKMRDKNCNPDNSTKGK